MLKVILAIMLAGVPFIGNTTVKRIELIYDSTKVFAGNHVRVSVRYTKSNGKIFTSEDGLTRFYCTKLGIHCSKGVEIGFVSEEYFVLNITEQRPTVSVRIRYKDRDYFMEIPVVDYRDQVKAVRIVKDDIPIETLEHYKIQIEAEMNDGSVFVPSSRTAVRPEDFKFTALSGCRLLDSSGIVLVLDTGVCASAFSVRVELKKHPQVYGTRLMQTISTRHKHLHYTGSQGSNGPDGNNGNEGRDGGAFRGIDGRAANSGQQGVHGTSGEHGPDLQVYLSRIKHPCSKDSVIRVDIRDLYNEHWDLIYLGTEDFLEISSGGGDGGKGGDGGNGGDGGDARIYLSPGDKYSGDGGDAGDGGDGGNGGNGGDGGDITVYYTPEAHPYLDQITFVTRGGLAGRYGKPGKPGKAGSPGNGAIDQGNRGKDGNWGQPGYEGYPGKDGTVWLIEKKTLTHASGDARE